MRNLKRALSLLLSSTMVLGMMVMGSSAAGYQDVDASNKNQEAIEVLQAVGIMKGIDTAGNFGPDQSVTRNQMAVIMAHLLNLDYDYYRGTNTFTDVPEWAAPYVAACVAEGVTAGIGNGLYGGENKVTAAQASLMIMKALGYFQYQEDFGSDWQVATIRQASYIDMFNNIDATAETALSRAQVAQLVLNGLKSDMVSFTGDVGTTATIGDSTIHIGYRAEYTPKTSTAAKYNSIVGGKTDIAQQGQYYIQLGEELYNGKLKLSNGSDDFQRPSRVWSYDGKEIGTYAKKELIIATYTDGVSGKDMYNLLTATTIDKSDLYSYVDGDTGSIKNTDLVRSNNDDLAGTGAGVVTEVYLDTQTEEITIASINSYLAKATSDYSKDKEYAPLNVYVSNSTGRNYNVDVEEVASVANVKEGAFYQVNISYKDNTNGEIVSVSDVKVLSDSTVTKFSTASATSRVSKLTVDGTEYKANEKAFYDDDVLNVYNDGLLTGNTYNVYVDANGYFLGVDLYSGESNYVFIAGYDLSGSHISVKTADASAIFLDGTMKAIKVNVKDTNDNIQKAINDAAAVSTDNDHSIEYFAQWNNGDNALNQWFTYTVDADGTYTLKPAVRMTKTLYTTGTDQVIRTDNLSIVDTQSTNNNTRVYGEDATVFLTVDTGAVSDGTLRGITEVTGVYTGVQNVDIEIDTTATSDATLMDGQIFTVYDKDWYAIGAVVLGDAVGADQNLAYILTNAKSEEKIGDTYYWEFDAILNGQVQTLTARSKYVSTIQALAPNTVQELRFDGDYVTAVKNLTDNGTASDDFYDYSERSNQIDGESVYRMNALDYRNTPANELTLQGRTMYITANRSDLGLALAADAKAVVIQDENGKADVKTEFTSVSSAIAHLADPNENTEALEYDGNIVAILDSKGVAQWVVFISDTELKTGTQTGGGNGPDYGVDGQELGMYSTVAEVNAALKNGNVVINGSWQPTDASSNSTVTIPANTTLKIDGNFDANGQGLVINATNATSKLIVTGEYDAPVTRAINYTVTADTMIVRTGMTNSGLVEITANVTVADDMTVNGDGEVKIAEKVTVTVGGDILNPDNHAKDINTYGTLKVTGNTAANITVNVLSTNSLYVDGTVSGTVVVGNFSTPGKAVIGTVAASATVQAVNGPVEVAVAGAAIQVGSKGSLKVTKALNAAPTQYNGETGGTFTLSTGVTVGGTAADSFKDGNGNPIASDNLGGNSFTIGAGNSITTDKVLALDFLSKAMQYQYTPTYNYNGDISVSGNTVTFAYNATPDRTSFMNDVVRFLGAMHRYEDSEVAQIIYGGKTFGWATDAVGGAQLPVGSQWTLNGADFVSELPGRNSLAYYIFGTATEGEGNLAAQNPTAITLVVDGQTVVLQRTVVSSTAAN